MPHVGAASAANVNWHSSAVRKAIKQLGRFFVVTSRHVTATLEIEALLDSLVGPNPEPVNSVGYLDWGVFRAAGMHGCVRVLDKHGDDVTSVVRQRFAGGPYEFDRVVDAAMLDLNRQILDGPSAQEEAKFRAQGYRPKLVLKRYEGAAAAEHHSARLIDQEPRWRKGRLRDVVAVREVSFQINNIVKASA